MIANRVFPAADADPWRAQWVEAQADVLTEIEQSFDGLPVWRSAYAAAEPVGTEALTAFATAAYGGADPLAAAVGDPAMSVTRTRSGATLRIALPFADKSDIDLARHGDELVVTVGSYRRLLSLPAALARQSVAGARVEAGSLQVRFRTDAAQEGLA